jgi:hypothetical protein
VGEHTEMAANLRPSPPVFFANQREIMWANLSPTPRARYAPSELSLPVGEPPNEDVGTSKGGPAC